MTAEYRRTVNDPTYGLLSFEIDKIGGGTVGKQYTGEWNVYIARFGVGIFDARITTRRPATHGDLMDIALEFAHAQGRI